ncbi:Calmodulin-lysine N-methyltransferase [Larimichthys crocea]|uniref:Uncharacterized protein n=1 Tax=Larimichthys crocea TaxID=215358 RepID=A0ACD3QBJ8_LARCR|nr:Calmodulin-lysine N-methyltransferase [Larimichthys crocea]
MEQKAANRNVVSGQPCRTIWNNQIVAKEKEKEHYERTIPSDRHRQTWKQIKQQAPTGGDGTTAEKRGEAESEEGSDGICARRISRCSAFLSVPRQQAEGMALVFAPLRGETLRLFCQLAQKAGLYVSQHQQYDAQVMDVHLKMLREGKETYDENIHYPLLITLTKGPQPVSHTQ